MKFSHAWVQIPLNVRVVSVFISANDEMIMFSQRFQTIENKYKCSILYGLSYD